MSMSLHSVEREMAGHPHFGLPSVTADRSHALYIFSLEILSDDSPAAKRLVKKLILLPSLQQYNFLRDPVLRHVLATGVRNLSSHQVRQSNRIDAILTAALASLERFEDQSPLEAEVNGPLTLHLGGELSRTFIWSAKSACGPHSEYFLDLVRTELSTGVSPENVVLRPPTSKMFATIEEGAEILLDLLPDLTRSVLPHAQMVGVVDVNRPSDPEAMYRPEIFESASTDTIPGTIFLSPNSLANSWRAAEALLHEAAHNKLFELIMNRSILRESYAQEGSNTTILAFWNKENPSNPRDWSVDRALLACHVYVYLTLFFAVIEDRINSDSTRVSPGGAIDASRTATTSFERASYLEAQLRAHAWMDIGQDGRDLMNWLRMLLSHLEVYVQQRKIRTEALN